MVSEWLTFLAAIAILACAVPLVGESGGRANDTSSFPATTPSPNWIEVQEGWRISSADQIGAPDASVSSRDFDASHWYPVRHMPATVLQVLEDDGVYKDLYYGMNLVKAGDLW